MMRENWYKLIDELTHAEILKCPNCGEKGIDYLYIGDEKTKIGYLQIWCNGCKKGINISRVKIPNDVRFVSFEESKNMELPSYDFL